MEANFRPVQVFRYQQDPDTKKWVAKPAETGLFHCWGVEHTEYEAGPGNASMAIVEFNDGKVETFAPHMVRFLDGGAK